MVPKKARIAGLLMAVIAPFCAGCASSCPPPPPPLVETKVVTVLPPDDLLADIPPPDLPADISSRDQFRQTVVDVAGYAAKLRARLADLRDWRRQQN